MSGQGIGSRPPPDLWPLVCALTFLLAACREAALVEVSIGLDAGGRATVFGAAPTLDKSCAAGRLAAIMDAHRSGALLAMRVKVDAEHEIVTGMQRAPRAEVHDGSGTLLIVSLDSPRLLTRDREGHWRLWEIPRALALDVCLAARQTAR